MVTLIPPGEVTPVEACFADIEINPDLWVLPLVSRVVTALDPDKLLAELRGELDKILDKGKADLARDLERGLLKREDAVSLWGGEIIDQSGNFQHYFHALLSLNSRSHPNLMRLMALVYAVAGIVGMRVKLDYMRGRPAQVWPGLFPMLPTPAHPSFPSNHATQATTVAATFSELAKQAGRQEYVPFLTGLAHRIGENREYAGLHYASDTEAGNCIGTELARRILDLPDLPELATLRAEALGELCHLSK